MARTELPVYVSIATIPSRIGGMKPTIDSLLRGNLVPDKIIVVRPEYCEWEKSGYDVPDFLNDPSYCREIVEMVVTSSDMGSSTKILGTLGRLPDRSMLVIADDDVIYHESFLNGLVEAQAANPKSSFSYYTYRHGGMTFATGCDGVSFYAPNLRGMSRFAQDHVLGTSLMYHDDLWIGFFLYRQGIAIRQIAKPAGCDLIYTQALPNDVLSGVVTGSFARGTITREGLGRLIKNGGLTTMQRLAMRTTDIVDRAAGMFRWHVLGAKRRA